MTFEEHPLEQRLKGYRLIQPRPNQLRDAIAKTESGDEQHVSNPADTRPARLIPVLIALAACALVGVLYLNFSHPAAVTDHAAQATEDLPKPSKDEVIRHIGSDFDLIIALIFLSLVVYLLFCWGLSRTLPKKNYSGKFSIPLLAFSPVLMFTMILLVTVLVMPNVVEVFSDFELPLPPITHLLIMAYRQWQFFLLIPLALFGVIFYFRMQEMTRALTIILVLSWLAAGFCIVAFVAGIYLPFLSMA